MSRRWYFPFGKDRFVLIDRLAAMPAGERVEIQTRWAGRWDLMFYEDDNDLAEMMAARAANHEVNRRWRQVGVPDGVYSVAWLLQLLRNTPMDRIPLYVYKHQAAGCPDSEGGGDSSAGLDRNAGEKAGSGSGPAGS